MVKGFGFLLAILISSITVSAIGSAAVANTVPLKTLKDPEFDVRFAAISDTHIQAPINSTVKAYINSILADIPTQQVHFGVVVGDTIYTATGKFPEGMASFQSNVITQTHVPFLATYGDHGKEWGKHRAVARVPEAVFGGPLSYTNSGTPGKG